MRYPIFATPMTIQRNEGHDMFGKPKLLDPVTVLCTPIRIEANMERTSIRTDRSATKANADEYTAVSRLLVDPKADIRAGDKVVCRGIELRVMSVYERMTFSNTRHHWQVDCEPWLRQV